MKEITRYTTTKDKIRYVCEICNQTYKHKRNALRCEDSHEYVEDILYKRQTFLPGNPYPVTLTVETESGKLLKYELT